MDERLDQTRGHRADATAATRRVEGKLTRVRVFIETVDGAADVVDRWRRR